MAKFKIPVSASAKPETPALLFRDLKRDASIKYLWGHQEKILDEYYSKHLKTRDLAIELPTGTGKTLVGLLLGEFRRRSNQERVLFLCSTNQLCSQVAGQARIYGIPAIELTGSHHNWKKSDLANYQLCRSIAITNYSALFNIKPKFDDPNTIICDDAHAGETFVPELWTLKINRKRHNAVFMQLVSLLQSVMAENVKYRLSNEDSNSGRLVDLISPIASFDLNSHIADTINAYIRANQGKDRDEVYFRWTQISNHLTACNIYCSFSQIEIRPVIPPTLTHAPFANAKQRIYMSATLGEDGDLERSFGVKHISRLPVPDGWEKRGTGRRLIFFPNLSEKTQDRIPNKYFQLAKRTLMLVPSDDRRRRMVEIISDEITCLDGLDPRSNIEAFKTAEPPVVLVLANRYDGIDFPGDECRSSIVIGVPTGAGLQETFLYQRLNASSVIKDRIRTRITQALGRCTRGETDFSIVIVLGEDLTKWFCTSENTAGLHPELRVEIKFGIENSEKTTWPDILELCEEFLKQTAEWDNVESYLRNERNNLHVEGDLVAKKLYASAQLEIDYTYDLWRGDYIKAFGLTNEIMTALTGGDQLRPYRCFWQHQSAVAAFLQFKQSGDTAYKRRAIDRLNEASSGSYSLQSLAKLSATLASTPTKEIVQMPLDEWFINLDALLSELRLTGTKFSTVVSTHREYINSKEAERFHQGLAFLGRMLGLGTKLWKQGPNPDCFWNFWNTIGVVFEAKTGHKTDGRISVSDVRQAGSHIKIIRKEKLLPSSASVLTVIVSPAVTISRDAVDFAEGLYYCEHASLISLFEKAVAALTEVRTFASTLDRARLIEEAEQIYQKHGLAFQDLIMTLTSIKLADLARS